MLSSNVQYFGGKLYARVNGSNAVYNVTVRGRLSKNLIQKKEFRNKQRYVRFSDLERKWEGRDSEYLIIFSIRV